MDRALPPHVNFFPLFRPTQSLFLREKIIPTAILTKRLCNISRPLPRPRCERGIKAPSLFGVAVVPVFLNNARFLKRGVCAVLLDVAEALDGGIHDDGFSEFRYENTAALDIRSASG